MRRSGDGRRRDRIHLAPIRHWRCFLLAGPGRVQVRSMSVILMPGAADARERRRHTEWETLVDTLTRADHMLTTGAISPVEHEAIWWQTYDRLEATTNV